MKSSSNYGQNILSENTLIDIGAYENNLKKLAFYDSQNLPFVMDHLTSNTDEDSYYEVISSLNKDLNRTAQYIVELQTAIIASNHNYEVDGVSLKDIFEEEDGRFNVLGISLTRHSRISDPENIKEMLLRKHLGTTLEEFKEINKIANARKTDNISLPIDADDTEKVLYLALKNQVSILYNFAEKVNEKLNLYKEFRKNLTNHEIEVLDKGVHGFSRTMIDGVLPTSTYIKDDVIEQISTRHQKDISHLSKIQTIQKYMQKTGIKSIEIDSDDSLDKVLGLVKETEFFTLNTTSKFTLKTRKLGNYTKGDFALFGMYFPNLRMIALDSRDPSALSHEYSHAIDYENDFVSDVLRNNFVSSTRNILQKQFHTTTNLEDTIYNYLILQNQQEVIEEISEKLGLNFNDKSIQQKAWSIALIASNQKSETDFLMKKPVHLIQERKEIREAFDILKNTLQENSDLSYYNEVDHYIKKPELADEFLSERITKTLDRGIPIKSPEVQKHSQWNYHNRSTEIIARCGELAYTLFKYDYQGHNTQEELDEWLNNVIEIQDQEIKQFGRIRGCHHIKEYIKRPEYFGFQNASPSFLQTLQLYYQPFFKPKEIFTLENGQLVSKENTRELKSVPEEDILSSLNSINNTDFHWYKNNKKKQNKRKAIREKFDKTGHPLSFLRDYDDVKGIISINNKEEVIDPKKLFIYIIENIDDLNRSRLQENLDINKENERMHVVENFVLHKKQFNPSIQKGIEILEKCADFTKNSKSSFERIFNINYKESDFIRLRKSSQKLFNFTQSKRPLMVFRNIVNNAQNQRTQPNTDYQQVDLKQIQPISEFTSQSIMKDRELNQNLEVNFSNIPKDQTNVDFVSSYYVEKINQASSKEEVLYYFLKSLNSISEAINYNYESILNNIPQEEIEQYNRLSNDFKDTILEFEQDEVFNETFERAIAEMQYSYSRRPLSINNEPIELHKHLSLEGQMELFSQIINNSDCVKAKTKQPKKGLAKKYQESTIGTEDIYDYFSTLTSKHIDSETLKPILSQSKYVSQYGKVNMILGQSTPLRTHLPDNLLHKSRYIYEDEDKFKDLKELWTLYIAALVEGDIDNKIEDYDNLIDRIPEDFIEQALKKKEAKKYGIYHHDLISSNELVDERKFINETLHTLFIQPIYSAVAQRSQSEFEFTFKEAAKLANPNNEEFNFDFEKPVLAAASVLQQLGQVDNPREYHKTLETIQQEDILKEEHERKLKHS